jgi:hypothetical protein
MDVVYRYECGWYNLLGGNQAGWPHEPRGRQLGNDFLSWPKIGNDIFTGALGNSRDQPRI